MKHPVNNLSTNINGRRKGSSNIFQSFQVQCLQIETQGQWYGLLWSLYFYWLWWSWSPECHHFHSLAFHWKLAQTLVPWEGRNQLNVWLSDNTSLWFKKWKISGIFLSRLLTISWLLSILWTSSWPLYSRLKLRNLLCQFLCISQLMNNVQYQALSTTWMHHALQ